MSAQLQRVHLPPQHPIVDQFPYHLYCQRFLDVRCRFVFGLLRNADVSFQPPSSLIGKVLALVMPFFVWHTPYRVLWRWGRRLE